MQIMGKTDTESRKVEPKPQAPRPSKPWLMATAGLLLAWIGFLIWLAYYSN
jgi:hypothetical protein